MSKWYIEAGRLPEVVASTRVRLARNLADFPFPERLDPQGQAQVTAVVKNALDSIPSSFTQHLKYHPMSQLDDVSAAALGEKHLISPEFACRREGRGLILGENESVSIMLCEEDHIRLQVLRGGFALEEAYQECDRIDTLLDSRLTFAFDERLGYLTQCPTNLGTGMRASLMMHLPALEELGQIPSLVNTVSRLGLAMRGTYGEGSNAAGGFYQLSNQVTLGISEEAALKNLENIAMQVMEREKTARRTLLENTPLEDRIWRSWGILSYARRLSRKEFMQLISNLRLGKALGILEVGYETLNRLLLDAQTATLKKNNANAQEEQLDALRADLVRKALYPPAAE